MYDKTLDLFEQLPFNPDDVTYTVVLNACAQLCDDRAKQMGMKLLKHISSHFQNNPTVLTSAIDMLMRFGDVTNAERLFGRMTNKNIITYGAMMNGYNLNHQPSKCFPLLEQMRQEKIFPDVIISVVLIGACAQFGTLSRCRTVLQHIPSHLHNHHRISNALVDMWASVHCVHAVSID